MEFWNSWLTDLKLQKYAKLLKDNNLEESDLAHFNHELLRSVGIDNAKDRLRILHKKKVHLQHHSNRAKEVKIIAEEAQSAIIERLQRGPPLNEDRLLQWMKQIWPCDREALIKKGYLKPTAPEQGLALIEESFRTPTGIKLLLEAKDLLWGCLFGDDTVNVHLKRRQRELLVITVPGKKAFPFNFFQAVTEVGASGTWRDPDNVSNDLDAPNMLLQVEYGDVDSEVVGDAVVVCIHVINLLEINEQILYARCSNVEQSTLLPELFFQKKILAH